MGLVAKANAGALAGGDPRALKKLCVQFRGMGVPEAEIVVTGTVKSVDGDRVVVDTVARRARRRSSRTRSRSSSCRSRARPATGRSGAAS